MKVLLKTTTILITLAIGSSCLAVDKKTPKDEYEYSNSSIQGKLASKIIRTIPYEIVPFLIRSTIEITKSKNKIKYTEQANSKTEQNWKRSTPDRRTYGIAEEVVAEIYLSLALGASNKILKNKNTTFEDSRIKRFRTLTRSEISRRNQRAYFAYKNVLKTIINDSSKIPKKAELYVLNLDSLISLKKDTLNNLLKSKQEIIKTRHKADLFLGSNLLKLNAELENFQILVNLDSTSERKKDELYAAIDRIKRKKLSLTNDFLKKYSKKAIDLKFSEIDREYNSITKQIASLQNKRIEDLTVAIDKLTKISTIFNNKDFIAEISEIINNERNPDLSNMDLRGIDLRGLVEPIVVGAIINEETQLPSTWTKEIATDKHHQAIYDNNLKETFIGFLEIIDSAFPDSIQDLRTEAQANYDRNVDPALKITEFHYQQNAHKTLKASVN